MYFHAQLILNELDILLPHKDGFRKVKNAYIQSVVVSVMTMALMQMKHGCMETGFTRQVLLSLRLQKDLHLITLRDG